MLRPPSGKSRILKENIHSGSQNYRKTFNPNERSGSASNITKSNVREHNSMPKFGT